MSIDKNRIKGGVKQAAGTVKEAVGDLTGDRTLELDGKLTKAEGKLQSAVGRASDAVKDAVKP